MSTQQTGFSTPTMVTSAVVVVVALLAVLAVLVARSRRTRLATAGYVEPMPSTPAPRHGPAEPDGANPWRRQLLEAIESAAALGEQDSAPPGAPYGPGHPHPGTGSPVHGSGTDPYGTAAWTPPFEPYIPPGPLESLFDSKPRDPGFHPADASPFGGFVPTENDPDSDYHGRRRLGEHPASDDDDTMPGSTGHSTP
ncbi:hypothetical protein ITP53_00545 [Nonomuraea sp. K274]|uniref:Uncharacterized protein n=1 Tax=Nonomuraea cypriaca TaxID=1187855 RepID=A0A931A6G5_9ACTN|nr:hypothetical protein [Nonomuraea cypriaca]MBF8184259.1 hypothetical protein [Nonomuraea cypriaca]